MFSTLIIFLTILIPSIQSTKPTLKLTFSPDEKYYTLGNQVEISCEIINPTDPSEASQLWYIDFKTNRRTPISRSFLNDPPADAPEIFRNNKQKRIEYVKKNHIRIRQLYYEDSSQYECNCPECEDSSNKQTKDLQVMKLAEPRWHIEPGWPIQEHAKTTIKCVADDFYPYVNHKIIRQHHEITNDGKAVTPTNNAFPHKFSWEATVTPSADWHNTTLRCTVYEGNMEQHSIKHLEVLFTPRFGVCQEKQHVDASKETSTIECSYAGNPAPKLIWFRQTDDKPLVSDSGITIETKDDQYGKYKSVITFERDKLMALPLTTTTKQPNGHPDTTPSKVVGENYYEQLLNGGFVAKLIYNNEEKGSQKVNIVSDASQARSNSVNNFTIKTREHLSTSIILFSFLIILYMIQHH